MTCCQHSEYSYIAVQGVRHAQCCRCTQQWLVVLSGSTGRTDEIPNSQPGVACRRVRL
jgi:hypothetical protein